MPYKDPTKKPKNFGHYSSLVQSTGRLQKYVDDIAMKTEEMTPLICCLAEKQRYGTCRPSKIYENMHKGYRHDIHIIMFYILMPNSLWGLLQRWKIDW